MNIELPESENAELCRVGGGFVILTGRDPKDGANTVIWLHTHRGNKGEPMLISGPVKVYPQVDLSLLRPPNKCVPIPEEQLEGVQR